MTYSRQDIRINTKITDEETLTRITQHICDFATKHNVAFDFGFGADNSLVATYEAQGQTSAYCKGMIAEIKQMFKDTFKCKIDVIFYAY